MELASLYYLHSFFGSNVANPAPGFSSLPVACVTRVFQFCEERSWGRLLSIRWFRQCILAQRLHTRSGISWEMQEVTLERHYLDLSHRLTEPIRRHRQFWSMMTKGRWIQFWSQYVVMRQIHYIWWIHTPTLDKIFKKDVDVYPWEFLSPREKIWHLGYVEWKKDLHSQQQNLCHSQQCEGCTRYRQKLTQERTRKRIHMAQQIGQEKG